MQSQRKFECIDCSIVDRDDAFPAEVRLYGWSIVHRDDNFPAEVRVRLFHRSPSPCIISSGRYGWSILHRTMHSSESSTRADQSFTVTMHSQRKFDYVCPIVHRDDTFPAEVLRLVNRSPWRCIPSGSSTTADQSFIVTIHSQRKLDCVCAIIHRDNALRAEVLLQLVNRSP